MDKGIINQECFKLISFLQTDTPEARSIKAALRHAVAEMPGENPKLWGWLISRLPSELQGHGSNISYAEWAIFLAVSLFSIGPKNNPKCKFAQTVATAGIDRRRLANAETANDMAEMQTSLRGLTKLIASKEGSFDYTILAEDLYEWQFDKTKIARKWEREYAQKETE